MTRGDTTGSLTGPSKRRLERIALYKAIIGYRHARILELGCGSGDLAYALVDHAQRIVVTDIDGEDIKLAQRRAEFWSLSPDQLRKIEFKQMSALQLDFSESEFDWAISTSMVEHLDPQDVERHLRECIGFSNPMGFTSCGVPTG